MNFSILAKKVEQATRSCFIDLYDSYGQEEVYAFAIYSDDGAMTICPAMNTIKAITDYKDKTSGEQFYEFETAEWSFECIGSQHFIEAGDYLDILLEQVADDDFQQFKAQLFETCVQVLEKLHNEQFFSKIVGKEIFLIFAVSDSNFAENLLPVVQRLNNDFYIDKYQQWEKALLEPETKLRCLP